MVKSEEHLEIVQREEAHCPLANPGHIARVPEESIVLEEGVDLAERARPFVLEEGLCRRFVSTAITGLDLPGHLCGQVSPSRLLEPLPSFLDSFPILEVGLHARTVVEQLQECPKAGIAGMRLVVETAGLGETKLEIGLQEGCRTA